MPNTPGNVAAPKPLFPDSKTPAPVGMFQGSPGVPRYVPLKAMKTITQHPQMQAFQYLGLTGQNWGGALAKGFHNDEYYSGQHTNARDATQSLMQKTPYANEGLTRAIVASPGYDQSKFNQVQQQQFVRRNPLGVNVTVGGKRGASYSPSKRLIEMGNQNHGAPGDTLFGVANHEYEHARQDVPGSGPGTAGGVPVSGGDISLPHEVPAGIGDLVFAGRAARHSIPAVPRLNTNRGAKAAYGYGDGFHPGPLQAGEYQDFVNSRSTPLRNLSSPEDTSHLIIRHTNSGGKPENGYKPATSGRFQHTVQFPSGYQQDINHMVDRAEEHGYFDGRSMTELLATTAGQQYLRQIASPPQLADITPATMRTKLVKAAASIKGAK